MRDGGGWWAERLGLREGGLHPGGEGLRVCLCWRGDSRLALALLSLDLAGAGRGRLKVMVGERLGPLLRRRNGNPGYVHSGGCHCSFGLN